MLKRYAEIPYRPQPCWQVRLASLCVNRVCVRVPAALWASLRRIVGAPRVVGPQRPHRPVCYALGLLPATLQQPAVPAAHRCLGLVKAAGC